MPHEWNIRPRSLLCERCQTPFKKGESCVSSIAPRTDEAGVTTLVRTDCCLACWKKSPDPGAFSTWQSIFHPSETNAREEVAPRQTVELLLRQLLDEADPARIPTVYVLALMLERKKILLERATRPQPDGTLLRLYEHRRTGEAFLVPAPHVRLDQLEPIQLDIQKLLESPPPPSP